MTNEEKNQGQGTPAPASGDKPEGTPAPEAPQPQEPKAPETPDYKAEAEQKEKELKEKEEQLKKAGFTIQKLKEKMKEEGIELEEGQGLSEEQIENVTRRVISEELGKSNQEIQSLKNTLSEVLKSIGSKQTTSKGGGEGGQKPPKEEGIPRPKMTDDEEETVKGMDWDSKRGGWQEKDITDATTGRVITKGKFYPHKRVTTSPGEEE